jgi:3-oxoacyl-[acyl-carrier-protein] synthase II
MNASGPGGGQQTPRPEVVVVGMGIVAPAGTTVDSFWSGLMSGRSFAEPLAVDDGLSVPACRVPEGDWLQVLAAPQRRRLDRICHLAVASAHEAVAQAGTAFTGTAPERRAVVAGIGFGGIATVAAQHRVFLDRGWRKISPFGVPMVMPSAVAAQLSVSFGIHGPSSTVSSACASGTQAIADAAHLIRWGVADVVVAGGVEAPLDPYPIAGFLRMDALNTREPNAARASRPFDRDRGGFVIGEGGAFLVLQRRDLAERDGTPVLATILGSAQSSDAGHITAPDAQGRGASACLRAALGDAGLKPGDVIHVNAHGTGTVRNDQAEIAALRSLFPDGGPPVTSVKGAIGHLMGGAGAVEAAATVLSLTHRLAPVTVNCDAPDPDNDLDIVRERPRPLAPGPALSCSFGFGGQNAALVIGPPSPA